MASPLTAGLRSSVSSLPPDGACAWLSASEPIVERSAAQRLNRWTRPSLRLLKWLATVLPLLFLGTMDLVRELLFPDRVYGIVARGASLAVLAVAIFLFSNLVFCMIAKLQHRTLEQNEHLATLNAIAAAAAEKSSVAELIDMTLERVVAALELDAGVICTVDLARGEHSAVASRGFSPELVRRLQRARLCEDPMALKVVQTGRAVVMEQFLGDPKVAELAEREGVRAAVSVPLKSQGNVTGIMALASRNEQSFSPAQRELLANVGSQLGMAIRQAAALERSLRRNREMKALLTVSEAVTSSLDLSEVLDRALETILDVASAEAVEVWLADDAQELCLTQHAGAAAEAFHSEPRLRVGEGLPGLALKSRAPVVSHHLSDDPRLRRTPVARAGFQTYCALPLVHRGSPLGVLGVAAYSSEALTSQRERGLLVGIAEVISVAIENARLYERVQDTAVVEERERIAREMHDGLAQVLTYVNSESLTIGRLLGSDRLTEAHLELERMQEAVRAVYADVREAILGLRSSPRSEAGLVPTLERYLELYEDMTDISVELEVSESGSGRLPPSTEIQLMRIVQEALSNVRKHAGAESACVRLERAGADLRLVVEDHGCGFDPARLRLRHRGWPRFGLQTMRERAEAMGGTFAMTSRPGCGTRVVVELSAGAPSAGDDAPRAAVATAGTA